MIPQVTTPLLKFMAEFVLNKAQRLTFDSSSPNGILLFREVSKLLVAYGSRVLSLPNPADIYAFKYKGIWISLTILARGKFIYFIACITKYPGDGKVVSAFILVVGSLMSTKISLVSCTISKDLGIWFVRLVR